MRARAGYIRSFNRFEIKYVLRQTAAYELIAGLEGYLEPDPHGGPRGYTVSSVYWDSPELDAFWEKLDGQKYRRKLRMRSYGEAPPEEVFVEIKQRIDRTVQKRRVRWPLERVRAVFGSGHVDSELEDAVEEPEAREALVLCRLQQLAPLIHVRYRRAAWTGVFEHDLRLTIDTRLRYDCQALDAGDRFDEGKSLLDPRLCVLEIKFNQVVPTWLVKAIESRGLETVRLSKYCSAVDRERFGGYHT